MDGGPPAGRLRADQPLPLHLDPKRALMRLVDGAELAVIIDIETHGVVQAERSGCAGIGAIPALAEALHGDGSGPRLTRVEEKFCVRLSTNLP